MICTRLAAAAAHLSPCWITRRLRSVAVVVDPGTTGPALAAQAPVAQHSRRAQLLGDSMSVVRLRPEVISRTSTEAPPVPQLLQQPGLVERSTTMDQAAVRDSRVQTSVTIPPAPTPTVAVDLRACTTAASAAEDPQAMATATSGTAAARSIATSMVVVAVGPAVRASLWIVAGTRPPAQEQAAVRS